MLKGVRATESGTGVFHDFCAGLGVMLTNSEKSKPWPGVLGKRLPPPGVVIIDDGKSSLLLFCGGVDGGSICVRLDLTAGEGDAARYSSKSAPSSPDFPPCAPVLLLPLFWRLPVMLRVCMGGVRGGEERSPFALNECAGSRSSSSSETAAKLGDVSSLVRRRC
jgi:hypothetical protein